MEKERKRKRSARDTKSPSNNGAFAAVGQAASQAAGAVQQAAGAAKAAVQQAAGAVQATVVAPVVAAVSPPPPPPKVEKVKRQRFVYTPPAEKRPAPVKADPPPKSKSTNGRLLVKNLAPSPDAPTAINPLGGKKLPG